MIFCLEKFIFTGNPSKGIFIEVLRDRLVIPNPMYISDVYPVYYVPFTIENKKVEFENWKV